MEKINLINSKNKFIKIIFGVDVSSSVHVDNNGKDVLILAEGQHKN